MYKKTRVFSILLLIMLISFSSAATPNGADLTPVSTGTAPADTAGNNSAIAGNVSEIGVHGFSTTQAWQGYYGNVSGTIQLSDSSNNVLYNWTQANPKGEVYASTNSSITWVDIQCFNFSASQSFASESGNGGTTNQNGLNLTGLETQYGVNISVDVDGVDETFTLSGAGTHDLFYTTNQQFSEGECKNTRVYSSTGNGVSNQFEEALLYEPTSKSVVFASLLENDTLGFNAKSHDFEMLVLENGHGVDVSTTTYYFFVELE